jgi:hypothetical protein
VSKPIFSSAYDAFADQGYLLRREGKYHAGPALTGQIAIDDLERLLLSYLPGAGT